MQSQQAFPLAWPPSWPRSTARTRAPFFATSKRVQTGGPNGSFLNVSRGLRSMAASVDEVLRQLRALGAGSVVISTNVELRQDGLPRSDRRQPADPGAAVYFVLRKRPAVLACDKWDRVEDNVWAVAKHLEALRGQERWGVGSVEQAFAGYTALPAPGQSTASTWYNVLGVPADASFEVVRDAWRDLARKHHPDNGGSSDEMARINAAFDQARKAFNR